MRGYFIILAVLLIVLLPLSGSNETLSGNNEDIIKQPVAGETVSPRYVIVDDYKGDSTYREWYYSRIGTDRGVIGDDNGTYTADVGGGTASVTVQAGWAGVWTSLIHKGALNEEIDPNKLLGPYIKDQFQSRITGVEIDVLNGEGQLKIELKDGSDALVAGESFNLTGVSQTLEFQVAPSSNISKLNWLVDGVGNVTVDELRLVVECPTYSVQEAVFLFTYGHLCQCYDAETGLVRDRARWPVEDFAAVQTIGTFALATAIALDLGYVTETDATSIIQKTKNTILNLPRHEKGLLPHFLKNGAICPDTEWSSIDTAIALVAQILACQSIGEDSSALETLLGNIDWQDLTDNGTHSISMGYSYEGQKFLADWDTFGSEALLAAIAYCASTGDNNVKLDKYKNSPTWDGSGFNDEMAALFFPVTGTDIWGNDWDAYRQQALGQQYNHLFVHGVYQTYGLFGLSASEVPEPWTMQNENDIYSAWGIGGHNYTPNTGVPLVGYPIIAPHYAAMIAAENPGAFEQLFLYLMDSGGIFTPLNNVESFGVTAGGSVRWNSLKGSWNLSLQVLGAGRALSGGNYLPYRVLDSNAFLKQGYIGIMGSSIDVTFPDGDEDLEVGTSHNITWNSSGIVGNVKIEYSATGGDSWAEIVAVTENDGSYPWTIPGNLSNRCLIRVGDVDGMPSDTSGDFFKIYQSSLTVTSPNGKEIWPVNSQQTIAWTSEGTVGNVRIEYSTDNGDTWADVIGETENDGSHPWNIPDAVSGFCLVRISDIAGTPTDTGDGVFSIVSSTSVTVAYPNGGETLYVGNTYNIAWTSSGNVGNVAIKYSINNGGAWTLITESTENDGSYSWTVPGTVSVECLIRIYETDGSPEDDSDNMFSILQPSTLTVTSPNGGENWEVNSNQTIKWTGEGNIENVSILYSADQGNTWMVITLSTPNDGSFGWQIPGTLSQNCLVRVKDSDSDDGVSDDSNEPFSIIQSSVVIPSITVTAPNGGEQLTVGDTYAIKWTTNETEQFPYVTIELSTDRGATWSTIAGAVPNSTNGSYNWPVPFSPSEECLIRVRGTNADGAPQDTSNKPFTILPLSSPALVVTAPNGGETYAAGYQHAITWQTVGTVDDVKLEYSTDNGDTWTEIIGSTPNTGSYDWTIPETTSSLCLVRVSDAGGQPADASDAVFSIVSAPSITVTSPNGGEQWPAGSAQNVKWNSSGIVGTVMIEYSDDGGQTWNMIDNNAANNGVYAWTVPDTPSGNCLVRVSGADTDDTGIQDVSDTAFTITEAQSASVVVAYPNGGETLFEGGACDITWNSYGYPGSIAIYYSVNGGQNWTGITTSTENDGLYEWTVPSSPSASCLVRVSGSGGDPLDISNAVFTIAAFTDATITVISPNGGESWLTGETYPVTWDSTGNGTNVSIHYSLNDGTSWHTVTLSTPNDGSHDWTLPDTVSTACRVRVSAVGGDWDGEPYDQSDEVFSIISQAIPAVAVLSPNGGESWVFGTTRQVTWKSTVGLEGLTIEYSTDNGSAWATIATPSTDTGSYDWLVPETPSDECLVRVHAAVAGTGEDVADTSDGLFSITAPAQATIAVQAPNGGESLYMGYNYDITWNTYGTVENVKLEFSPDGGDNWTTIAETVENTGTFEWTVPGQLSQSCLVRVGDTGGSPVDISDAVFSIIDPPEETLTVTAPNGGEEWEVGGLYFITWTNTGSIENVSIEYSTNDGATWLVIKGSTPNEGSYEWMVPNTPSETCRVRVTGLTGEGDGGPNDISDEVFTIVQPVLSVVRVVTPNGGEELTSGSQYNITWNSSNIQNVLIEFSDDNGESWQEVDTADATGGGYTWTVPDAPSATCLIRVSGNDGGQNPSDTSDSVFTII